MMKRGIQFISWFVSITTGVLIVCAIQFALVGEESLPGGTLWQILLSGLLTAAVTTALYPRDDCSGKKAAILRVLHYLALCAVMFFCGWMFDWMAFNLSGILMMVVSVGVVYLMTGVCTYLLQKGQAEQMNEKIREKYSDEE
ncbi:MAG: DUF3021 domain-containing protein [Firmicutes bacterium]|jgi:hypothetical protein|nr:DUF3021 domain-containing protein [Bacillota bacterium]